MALTAAVGGILPHPRPVACPGTPDGAGVQIGREPPLAQRHPPAFSHSGPARDEDVLPAQGASGWGGAEAARDRRALPRGAVTQEPAVPTATCRPRGEEPFLRFTPKVPPPPPGCGPGARGGAGWGERPPGPLRRRPGWHRRPGRAGAVLRSLGASGGLGLKEWPKDGPRGGWGSGWGYSLVWCGVPPQEGP